MYCVEYVLILALFHLKEIKSESDTISATNNTSLTVQHVNDTEQYLQFTGCGLNFETNFK